MPELRFNILTQEWVIISPGRSKRPMQYDQATKEMQLPVCDPACPFCPGSEEKTSVECYRLSVDGEWSTRCVMNKYPALDADVEPTRSGGLFNTSINGFGIHEVIIDTPRHDLGLTTLPLAQVERMLYTYRERYLAAKRDERVQHIIIFKNNGDKAGSSLIHPHSQLIATPIVSSQIDERIRVTRQYRESTGDCLMCAMIARELELNERIIFSNDHFVSFLPYAALSSFHTWVFPRRHAAHFGRLKDHEIPALAEILSLVIRAQEKLLNKPDYNFVIRSAPVNCPDELYHWYISIIPRLSKTAGFEIGSNIYINTSLPEHNALELRNVVDIVRGTILD